MEAFSPGVDTTLSVDECIILFYFVNFYFPLFSLSFCNAQFECRFTSVTRSRTEDQRVFSVSGSSPIGVTVEL